MDKEKVLKLAQLARVEISDAEAETLSSEFGAILDYVGQVKKLVGGVSIDPSQNLPLVRGGQGGVNVLREDSNPHESGLYTEAILKNAPQKEGEFIKVKKIL